jgi:tape measure domain-containing protein
LGRALGGDLSTDLGKAGERAGDAASEGFGSRFKAGVATAAKAAAAGVLAAGAAAAGFGLKIAANNEQAQVSFETMLGSAEVAGDFLKDLKKFAATTPFEFPELQTAASSLIAIGVDAKKVIPIMRSLGNVTAGMGTGAEGVKRATVALQQMNAAGRITAEDLNQLRDAGIPVFDLLTAATGKTKEELAGMAQNGKLGRKELEQLMTALETGKGLERFNGLMEKQALTLSGIVSTLKDTLGQGLADAVAPAIPAIKQTIEGLSEVLGETLESAGPVAAASITSLLKTFDELEPLIKPVVEALSASMQALVQTIGPIVEQVTPLLVDFAIVISASLNEAVRAVLPAFGALLASISAVLPPIAQLIGLIIEGLAQGLAGTLVVITPVVAAFVQGLLPVFAALQGLMPSVAQAFAVLGPPILFLVEAATKVGLALAGGLLKVLQAIAPQLPVIAGAIGPLAVVVADLAVALVPIIGLFADLLATLVPVLVETLTASGIFKTIEDSARTLGVALADSLLAILTALGPALPDVVRALATLVVVFADLLLAVAPILPPLIQIIAALAPAVATILQFAAALLSNREVMEVVVPLLLAAVAAFKLFGALPAIALALQTAFVGAIVAVQAFGAALLANPVGLIVAGIAALIAGLVILYQKWEPFRNLIDGFVDGLRAALGWVVDFGKALFSWDTDRMGEMLLGLADTIGAFFRDTLLPFLQEKGSQLAAAALGWIAEVAPQLPGKLAGIIIGFNVWLYGTAIPWLITNGLNLAGAILQWISTAASQVIPKLGEVLSAFGHWVAESAVPWIIQKGADLAVAALLWLLKLNIEIPALLAKVLYAIGEWVVTKGVPGLITFFTEFVPAALKWIDDVIRAAPGKLVEFGGLILDFIRGLPDQIADAAKNMFVGLTNAFLASFNWIVRTWNQFRLNVPEIEVLGQKIGGFTLDTPDIAEMPYIQGFASGGRPPTDRPSMVGERGPELFWPDRAGTVFPNKMLDPAATGSGGGFNVGGVTIVNPEPVAAARSVITEMSKKAVLVGARR